jgi:hypothetical protein
MMITVLAVLGAIFGGAAALAVAGGVLTLVLMPIDGLWRWLNASGIGPLSWVVFAYAIPGALAAFAGGRFCWRHIQSIRMLPAGTHFYESLPILGSVGIALLGLCVCLFVIVFEMKFRP